MRRAYDSDPPASGTVSLRHAGDPGEGRRRSVAQHPTQVVVGENAVGVEALAKCDELAEARVRRRQVGGGPGMHLAPVRAPAGGGEDRFQDPEVVARWSTSRWMWKAT